MTPRPINYAHRAPRRAFRGTALTLPRVPLRSARRCSRRLLMWIGRGEYSANAKRRDDSGLIFYLSRALHVSGRPRHKHARACDEPSSRRGSRSAYRMEMRGDAKREDLASLGNDRVGVRVPGVGSVPTRSQKLRVEPHRGQRYLRLGGFQGIDTYTSKGFVIGGVEYQGNVFLYQELSLMWG